jgi:hypothetical protein
MGVWDAAIDEGMLIKRRLSKRNMPSHESDFEASAFIFFFLRTNKWKSDGKKSSRSRSSIEVIYHQKLAMPTQKSIQVHLIFGVNPP